LRRNCHFTIGDGARLGVSVDVDVDVGLVMAGEPKVSGDSDRPLNLHAAASLGFCSNETETLDHPEREFYDSITLAGWLRRRGLQQIGGGLPIAPWGRSSL
jgi:hypothetical protein